MLASTGAGRWQSTRIALLPVEEAQHLETWRNPIVRAVEIGLPSSIRGRARSDRSGTALSSTDCLRMVRKHGTLVNDKLSLMVHSVLARSPPPLTVGASARPNGRLEERVLLAGAQEEGEQGPDCQHTRRVGARMAEERVGVHVCTCSVHAVCMRRARGVHTVHGRSHRLRTCPGHPSSSDGAGWRFIAASVSSPCPCTEHMPYASLASWCTQAEAPSLPLARPHAEAPSLPPTVRTFVVGRVTVSTVGDLRRAVLCEISYACPELGS